LRFCGAYASLIERYWLVRSLEWRYACVCV